MTNLVTNISPNNEEGNENLVKELLYDKRYQCPVCDKSFTSKAIRSGKNRIVSTDTDLYSKYNIVNPLIYDIILCTSCGYAALSKNFEDLRATQVKWIRDEISSKYKPQHYPDILTTKHAIDRYKLALLSAMVKKARNGEKAYLCLKIGWLYRDLGDTANELTYLTSARDSFKEAFSKERFPIFELDELTTMYIISDISRRCGDYEDSLRWISDLIFKPGIPSRLKSRAIDLKDTIREESKA